MGSRTRCFITPLCCGPSSTRRGTAVCEEGARIEAIARRVAAAAGFQRLKQEQVQAVVEFVRGRDVFVSLPTGFGKSLIYGILPAVIEIARGRPPKMSIALVISPLSALMLDQKSRFIPSGIGNCQRRIADEADCQ